jgi:lysophospholipase L1-like esterase
MMNLRSVCVVLVAMGVLVVGGGCRSGTSGSGEAPASRVVERDRGGEAEAKWYEPEIRAYESADRASPPEPGMVLFVGSSSVRMWSTLAADMAPARVLNRGFGGSKTGEVLDVFERIVAPYEPRAIVYYCGDNDLGTENRDAEGTAAGFIAFEKRARALWPEVEVMYIAIKPSISRWSNWEAMKRANEIVRGYCERTDGATFLDIATPMLGADGKPNPALFMGDGLHVNAKGYEVWTGVVRPEVVKAWEGR